MGLSTGPTLGLVPRWSVPHGRGMGQIIAFVPASGGAGATTLGAALAIRAAAAQRSVVAVDLDRWSGGLDVVFGVEQEPGWRWDALADVAGVVDGGGLARRLPCTDGVPILSTSRGGSRFDPGAWLATVPDVLVGLAEAHELVVVDAPRDLHVLEELSGVLDVLTLVAGTTVTQLAASATVANHAREVAAETWVVLRGSPGEELADLVMDELDLPIVDTVRRDPRVSADVTDGVPPGVRGRGPVVEVADRLLLRLAERAGDERVLPRWTLRRSA